MATTSRNVRIDDELYEAVQEKAALEERNVSEVIRELLTGWVAKPPRPVERRLRTWKD